MTKFLPSQHTTSWFQTFFLEVLPDFLRKMDSKFDFEPMFSLGSNLVALAHRCFWLWPFHQGCFGGRTNNLGWETQEEAMFVSFFPPSQDEGLDPRKKFIPRCFPKFGI